MVIRFQFAALTERNGEGNEVSHLTVCVCKEEEMGGVKYALSTFFSGSLCLSYSNSLCKAVYCRYHSTFVH